jgi:predicted membrane-bound spermidine synthase
MNPPIYFTIGMLLGALVPPIGIPITINKVKSNYDFGWDMIGVIVGFACLGAVVTVLFWPLVILCAIGIGIWKIVEGVQNAQSSRNRKS